MVACGHDHAERSQAPMTGNVTGLGPGTPCEKLESSLGPDAPPVFVSPSVGSAVGTSCGAPSDSDSRGSENTPMKLTTTLANSANKAKPVARKRSSKIVMAMAVLAT